LKYAKKFLKLTKVKITQIKKGGEDMKRHLTPEPLGSWWHRRMVRCSTPVRTEKFKTLKETNCGAKGYSVLC
jgi:hypothetical protein